MLWGLCYRMTGVAADADELVQETFARAIERPPPAVDEDWHRWLVRVATNLSVDRLRARRRRAYSGSWLPSPVETPDVLESVTDERAGVEANYQRLESVSYAFLLALEALAPKARAVLILCDVFDYPAGEVAALLDTSESNVRVLHHRARRNFFGALAVTSGFLRGLLDVFIHALLLRTRTSERLLTGPEPSSTPSRTSSSSSRPILG